MELAQRPKGGVYAPPGRYQAVQSRLQARSELRDIPVLFVYAFDFRTRLGPFLFIDKRLIPGAPIAVGAALHAAGFRELRLVLQQWTPNIRPSEARINGKPPELLLVSSMQIHSAAAYALIRDAWNLGDRRPLVVAGGAKAIYEPWDFFAMSPDGSVGADVVVTGEESVLIELLDRILEFKSVGETLRQAFDRVRCAGHLADIPGLVFRPDESNGPPSVLIDTGIQRLVQNLDELPFPLDALGLFEPRHRRRTLSRRPLPVAKLKRSAKILSIVTSRGCKFRCSYCPIPAYNQFTFRHKSPERLVEELTEVRRRTGLRLCFGTDDNFFNDRKLVEATFSAMANTLVGGKPFHREINWATQATEFDVFKNRDLLPLARDAGLRLLWLGVEDMTAKLVNKGQSPEKTEHLFRLLLENDIGPMPMLMHHDGQPLYSRYSLYGLLNQVRYLRRAGALSMQVTFLTPSVGSKDYERPYRDGIVLARVGGQRVDDYLYDGNHCVATRERRIWRRHLNVVASCACFYNPLNILRGLLKFDGLWNYRVFFQSLGNLGVVRSLLKDLGWIRRVAWGRVDRLSEPPQPKFPLVAPRHFDAEHTLCEEGTRPQGVAETAKELDIAGSKVNDDHTKRKNHCHRCGEPL